tara:strand:+ start:282 stop:500 length:219 start_codon:yes stop_codon:yes gene_type:complete
MADDISGDLNVFGSVNAATYYGDATQFSALAAPQLTSTQRDALTSPFNGLLIYNTSTDKIQAYVDGAWTDMH